LIQGKKLSIGVFENYISVQLDDHSFEILGGLDQKYGFVIDKPIVIPKSKMDKIAGIKIYDVKKVAVFGTDGTVLFYDIVSNNKIKLIYEKMCLLEAEEMVDCYDILVTGQIITLVTKLKDKPVASRLLIFKIDPKTQTDKHWIFDFKAQPQKYTPTDYYSNFFSV
jgi:hypothetical protein